MRNLFLLILLSLNVFACGTGAKREELFRPSYESCLAQGKLFYGNDCSTGSGAAHAQGRYSILNDAKLLKSLAAENISVCIAHQDLPASRILEVQMDVEKAFRVWRHEIEDLLPNKNVTLEFKTRSMALPPEGEIEFRPVCDETSEIQVFVVRVIQLNDEDREHAYPRDASIFLNKSSKYSTILHEMGHLFGLSDIYIEDVWTCKDGFSNSVMCNSAWAKPVLDDSEAVRRAYCLTTEGQNPKCFNYQKSGILNTLPASRYRFKRAELGSYFECFSESNYFRLSYSIVNFSEKRDPEDLIMGGEFFSTDDHSVKESFNAGEYVARIETRFYDRRNSEYEIASTAVTYTISKNSITIDIPSKGIRHTQPASECSFDDKFLSYLETNGVDSSAIRTRLEYNQLFGKSTIRETDYTRSDDVKFNVGMPSDEDISKAELKIFASNDERTLLKSIALNTLTFKKSGSRIQFEFGSTLGLEPGTYFIYLDKVTEVYSELKLIVEKPVAL